MIQFLPSNSMVHSNLSLFYAEEPAPVVRSDEPPREFLRDIASGLEDFLSNLDQSGRCHSSQFTIRTLSEE